MLLRFAICQAANAQGAKAPDRTPASPSDPTSTTAVALVRLGSCPGVSAWPAVEKRIEKELSLSNLTVLVFDRQPAKDGTLETVLDSVLRSSAARGAVLVAVSPGDGVQLHALFYNRETGILEYRRHFLGSSPTPENTEVAAIKAREAVLATLYERNPSPYADTAPSRKAETSNASPSRASAREETADSKRVQLYGAFGMAWSPGGVGVMGSAGGGLIVRLSHRFALGADGWLSVPRREIKAAIGDASVRLIACRVIAAFLFRHLGPVQPAVGLRIGILNLRSEGKSATHPVASGSNLLFYGSAFAEAIFQIAERVVLPISLDVGAYAPGVDILFAGVPEAAMNVFMLEANIGIGVLL